VFFRRLGVKYTLMLGMFAWVLRYVCFGTGNSSNLVWLLYLGIVLQESGYELFLCDGPGIRRSESALGIASGAQA